MVKERPDNFVLNNASPLARGLVFAGLGRSPGSVRYKDSSSRHNDGVLTNMDPKTDWIWVPELGRWGLDFDGVDEYATALGISKFFCGATVGTIATWVKIDSSIGTVGLADSLGVRFMITWSDTLNCYFSAENEDANYPYTYVGLGWHHITLVYDGSLDAVDRIRGYVDGIQKTLTPGGSTTPTSLSTSFSADYIIANRMNTIFGDQQTSDVLLYTRVLSVGEIQALADRSNPMLGGLIKPPKRKYWGVPHIRPGYRYKLGRLLLQRT